MLGLTDPGGIPDIGEGSKERSGLSVAVGAYLWVKTGATLSRYVELMGGRGKAIAAAVGVIAIAGLSMTEFAELGRNAHTAVTAATTVRPSAPATPPPQLTLPPPPKLPLSSSNTGALGLPGHKITSALANTHDKISSAGTADVSNFAASICTTKR